MPSQQQNQKSSYQEKNQPDVRAGGKDAQEKNWDKSSRTAQDDNEEDNSRNAAPKQR